MFVALLPAAWLVKYFTKAPFFRQPVLVAGQAGAPEETAEPVRDGADVRAPDIADPAAG
jgi:hypothetical protein